MWDTAMEGGSMAHSSVLEGRSTLTRVWMTVDPDTD